MKRAVKKSLYKIFVSLFIVFYSFVPPSMAIGQVIEEYSQEDAAPIVQEEIPEESLLEQEVVLEEEEVPPTVEEPVVEKPVVVTDTPLKEIVSAPTWVIHGETATTYDDIELGKTYISPHNSRVRVIFTKLPEKSSKLTIEEIILTQQEMDATGAISEKAYDITTDMENGTFEYDLELPSTEDNVKIVYVEEREDIFTEVKEVDNTIINQKDTIKIKGLEHFTIYIASTTVKISGQVSGSNQVTVTPGATITVTMEVELSGSTSNDWYSTRYQIEGGSSVCVDTPNHTDTGTHSESFNITAPTAPGTYDLTLRASDSFNCGGNQSEKVMKDAIIVQIPSNPPLPTEACGLDIALVLDVSGSISASELKQMKDAFKAFVDALSGTPTQFSVIKFDNTASILLPFTSVTTTAGSTAIKNAIDNASGGGYTNWEDGLNKAWLTYDPRTDKPNLIIFSSDGNPNRIGAGTTASEAQSVAAAVAVANTIKAAGTRILALGIGSDLKTGNMIAISGPNVNTGDIVTSDVISTNFSTLATDLGKLASKTCGGTITVNKYIDDTSTPGGAGWTYTVSSGTITKYLETKTDGSANTGKITAGTYSVVETGIPLGYSYGSATCKNDKGTPVGSIITNGLGSITVSDEDIISCDFINTRNKGSITIVKNTVGGDDTFSFTSDFGVSSIETTGGTGSQKISGLTPGTYSISETVPTGWNLDLTQTSCDDGSDISAISLSSDEEVTCTFTNVRNQGTITVVKEVVNDNGGNATVNDFGIKLNGGALSFGDGVVNGNGTTTTYTSTSTVNSNVLYTLTENDHSGYVEGSWSCKDNSTTATVTHPFTLLGGQSVTCTITNNDIAPSLTLVKEVKNNYGGNAKTTDWTLTATGPTNISGGGGVTSGTGFKAGTYTLSESGGVTGYSASNWTCTNDITPVNNKITLGLGQSTTCTITNSEIQPTLTLVKTVTNQYGGNKKVADFKLYIGGDEVTSGTSNNVSSNTEYTVSEDQLSGYEASVWGGDCSEDGKITLTSGQNATCTVTNSDIAPTLKIVKEAINDNGGTATIADFGITLTDTTLSFGAGSTANKVTTYVANPTVESNKAYTLAETGATGYTQKSLVCLDGTTDIGSTFTLNPGQNVECKIVNDDKAPKLTLNKIVSNTQGGNKAESAWTLYAKQGEVTALSGLGASGNADVVSIATFQAGTYTLSETGPGGYTASAWSCEGTGSLSGSAITLKVGQEAVCSITNSDNKAGLKVVKKVVNDNGGNATVDEFGIKLNGGALSFGGGAVDGSTTTYTSTPSVESNKAYTLTEGDHKGYVEGTWSCVDNNGGTVSHPVTLSEGQGVTCTITNNDIAPKLTLTKVIAENYGGNAEADDFKLTVGGESVLSGKSNEYKANTAYAINETVLAGYKFVSITGDDKCPSVLGGTITLDEGDNITCTITNTEIQPTLKLVKTVTNQYGGKKEIADFKLYIGGDEVTSGTSNNVNSNTEYTVSEDQLPGYTASVWGGDCSEDGKITLTSGQNATCTITNSDIAPTLKIVKEAINDNGGTATIADFGITLTDTILSFGAGSTANKVTTYEANPTVVSNKAYTLVETGATGYTQESLVCLDGNTNVGSTFTLNPGQNVVCTIVNDDKAPKLTLNKIVSNTQGGNKLESAWTLYAKQGEVTALSGPGASGNADVVSIATFQAGTYTLSETGPGGYTASAWSCTGTGSLNGSAITLGVGQEAVCSITNSDNKAGLTVVKKVVNDNGGNATVGEFEIKLNGVALTFGNGVVSGTTTTYTSTPSVESNKAYTLTEIDHKGYVEGTWSCVDNNGETVSHPVTLSEGQKVTCTITNDDIAPTLTVIKNVVNDNGGNATVDEFGIKLNKNPLAFGTGVVNGTTTTYTSTSTVNSNVPYELTEEKHSGYKAYSWSCKDNSAEAEFSNKFTLSEGQSITCTITNDDIAPQLTVIKIVDNDGNDGTKSASDFKMIVEGTNVSNTSFPGSETGVTVTLDQGDFEVTEDEDTENYEATYVGCSGSINVGETKTCTITNTGIDHLPTIEVTKEASKTSVKETGENITFTFTVKNTSKVDTVEITSLTDSVFGPLTGDEDCEVGTVLAVDGSCSFTITENISGDFSGDDHENTFTAVGKDEEKNEATDSDDETITFTDVKPDITVTKTAGVTEIPETGGKVTFTFTVTNNSEEEGTITVLTDSKFGKLAGDADCKVGTVLAGKASCNFTAEFDIPANKPGDPKAPTKHTNIFTATVKDNDGNKDTDKDKETIKLTPVPSLKLVKKVVHKYNSDRGITAANWKLSADGVGGFDYAGNKSKFKFVQAGEEYTLSESGKYMSQFEAGEWVCNGGTLNGNTLTLNADDDVTCTITNTAKPATIIVYKDVRLGEKDIHSGDIFKVILRSGRKTVRIGKISDSDEENPLIAEFTPLNAGKYTLKEINVPDGYISKGCYPINTGNPSSAISLQGFALNGTKGTYHVGNGETLEFVCTNNVIEPLLEIEKSNDKQYIDQHAGDEVTYTITVTAPSDDKEGKYVLNDVIVSDIAPAGFNYLFGTWTAKKNGFDIPVPQPKYDGTNPATWLIGDMKEGDIVVLTYRTKISLLQEPGKYPDIAWVKGISLANETVLGVSATDNSTPFVGTDVTVIEPIETEEGEVLGASITLPRTGASTYLTLGAIIMMILGTFVLLFKPLKKLKYALLAGLMAISFITLLTPKGVMAADTEVRIMQPATPTNKTSFDIGFVALDLNNDSITVECYKDSVQFATFTASTGNCPAKVTASGTYTFYVKANGEQSDTVTVVVDLEKPSPVIDYSKAGNILKFKTANDGKTKKVEIFRSEKPSYTANESTRIDIMSVSPNTEYSWTDITAQTGKTYYYALRAVDELGNASTLISDPEVVLTTSTTPTTPTTDTGSTVTDTEGEVAGEETTPDDDTENGEVKAEEDTKTDDDTEGEDDNSIKSFWSKYRYIIIIAVVVALSGGVYEYVRRKR